MKSILVDITNDIINDLLKIQSQSYLLDNNSGFKLLQKWQELSANLNSIKAPSIIIDLISKNEILLNQSQNQDHISTSRFNTLYTSIIQFSEYLANGRITENFEKINVCNQCRENPVKNMPKECREDFKRLEISPTIALTDISSERFRAKSNILLISNSIDTCIISEQLKIHHYPHDKIHCIQDLYSLGKEIWNMKLLFLTLITQQALFFLH